MARSLSSRKQTLSSKKVPSTYVLGISCYYHDASAALYKDGIVVAAAEEERFTRKKHDHSFPKNAIAFCLNDAGISIKDITAIGFYEKPFIKFERVLYQHLQHFPKSIKTFLSSMPSWVHEKLRVMKPVRKLGYKGDVYFVEHHRAHAASSFLVSPFNDAAIVTIDGVGEWQTTTWGVGHENDITIEQEIVFPHSLGLLYSTITAYLGFSVNNSEYKVMGLAPYGVMDTKKNKFYKKLKQVIDVKLDGSYALNMEYFVYDYKDRMPSRALVKLLGMPIRDPNEKVTQAHMDVAAALQLVLEETLFALLTGIQKKTQQENLVIAGGVALNSVANGKILRNTPFKRIWIQPNASDGGTSIGAAAYVYHSLMNKPRVAVQTSAYLGPQYSDAEIEAFLKKNKIVYTSFRSDRELIERTAELLSQNAVIGWSQGRMEWGPRALGARSILANPMNQEAKELLNTKVKHREHFRPFAPVVCTDDALTYFDCDVPVPAPTDFMLMVYPVRAQYRKKIPSVTHVDGSGRLQTVNREQNARYYDLLKAFGKRTGVPILINTSFNIRGEPIVCSPFDAYKCMMGTGIDYLVIGSFLVKRDDNLRDAWDSEKYAND